MPIQRAQPLVHQVHKYLRDAILSGELAAGEKVVETRLASDLQVSRSPVREAIRLLIAEQLLIEQDGAIMVFQPTFHDFHEIYELRLAVEPAAARRAAELVQREQLERFEQNLEDTRQSLQAGNMERLVYLNSEFHRMIWEISGNTRFIRIMDTISVLIHYYCMLVLNINNHQTNILREHADIYQALKEGTPQRAHEAMYEHIMKDLDVIDRQAQGQTS